jgi:hypothetical protein
MKEMNVTIEIHYISNQTKVMQAGSFPLRGKSKEQVALNWWKQIKKEMSYHAQLEKVIANGDKDITELVKELEKKEWRKRDETSGNLPF